MKTLLIFLVLSYPNVLGKTVTNYDGTNGTVIRQYNTEVKVKIGRRTEYWSYSQIKEVKMDIPKDPYRHVMIKIKHREIENTKAAIKEYETHLNRLEIELKELENGKLVD